MRVHFLPSLIAIFALVLALSSPAVALEDLQPTVNVSIISHKDAVYPGDCNKYTATVKNLDGEQRVDLSINGDRLSWITLTSAYLDFNTTTPEDVIFYLCPVIGSAAGTYNFDLTAHARSNNYSVNVPVPVYVLDRPYVEIKDVVFSKDTYRIGEPAKVTVNIRNLGAADAKNIHLLIEITGANAPGKIRAEVPVIETGRGVGVSEDVEFDRYLSHGKYTFNAKIVDDIGDVLAAEKSGTLQIEEKSELQQETTVKNSMLSKFVTLTGSNNGNIGDTIALKDSGTGLFLLYSFDTQPTRIESSAGLKTFIWECSLAPAESCTVNYQVDYWLLVLTIAAVFGITYVIYNVMQQPRINKRIIKKDKEHAVHIAIKNRSRKTLQNIQVIDYVPEIVSVVAGSLSPSVKPAVKGKRGGVEITWTFAKLSPGEERVITYRIKPVVMVLGKIHLPKARIMAVDESGKKYDAKSEVVIE